MSTTFLKLLLLSITLISIQTVDTEVKGTINCTFFATLGEETKILGDFFTKPSQIEIIVNDKEKIDFTNSYTFPNEGLNKISFTVFDNLNLDYMFEDVPNLKSVIMNSDSKSKITSMKRTFENTKNLNTFVLKGFDTSEVKEMKKLFFNSFNVFKI